MCVRVCVCVYVCVGVCLCVCVCVCRCVFVKGRQLLHGVLVANEVVEEARCLRGPAWCLKWISKKPMIHCLGNSFFI